MRDENRGGTRASLCLPERAHLLSRLQMASGYAARLTKGVDYGVCGLPEEYDEINSLMTKIETLVRPVLLFVLTNEYTEMTIV